MSGSIEVPPARREPLARALALLADARSVALTTHVNADGDGAGSEAALGAWLRTRGKRVVVVNPSPFPEQYRWLLGDGIEVVDARDEAAASVAAETDLLVVLDTGEPKRLERVHRLFAGRPTVVIDHHPPVTPGIEAVVALQDVTACATGELIYDLLSLTDAEEWPPLAVEAIYTAIVTDTGSFRYANTSPRTHTLAADLIRRGIDPEAAYRRLFGSVPLRRVRLLCSALQQLEVDEQLPMTWVTIPRSVMSDLDAGADDLDGIIEQARSIEGTEVALLFRETNGSTKVSFRSNGELDVNALARQFGGGGHVKAAGALLGGGADEVRPRVLEATRAAVREMLASAKQ